MMRKQIFLVLVICLSLSCFGCEKKKMAEVGKAAPDFTLVDRNGKIWTLSELKGQVVFINFWATWCPPCREELPSMQKLHSILPKDNFKMLAILNKDDPKLVDSFAVKRSLTMPILNDEDNKIGSIYGLTGLPETFIVDKRGVLRQKIIGPANWNSPKYIKMIMKYMNPLSE